MNLKTVEDATIVLGTAVGLSQIETILGIVILSVQILLVLARGGWKIYQHLKAKEVKEALEDAEDVVDQIEKLKGDKEDEQTKR